MRYVYLLLLTPSVALIGCSKDNQVQSGPVGSAQLPGEPGTTAENDRDAIPNDADITAAISRELAKSGNDPAAMTITTREGIVELSGTVDSLLHRERATRVAELVRGVRAISNRLQVDAAERSDEAIAADVRTALRNDPAADSYQLRVQVNDAVVTLEGTVDSWHQERLAERLAMGVKGIEDVVDQMSVKYGAERLDSEIQADIASRLAWDILLDDSLITTEVRDGTVHLSGTAGSLAELRRARARAWVNGVEGVDTSNLTISWVAGDPALRKERFQAKPDQAIEDAITRAALYDPRAASFELDVDSRGGVVTLDGAVDNLRAKMAAEQLARNTVGVVSVINNIAVKPEPDDDKTPEGKIRAGLAINPITESFEITVDVDDGVATLRGTVDTFLERAEATDVALGTAGVTTVNNDLQVADPTTSYVFDPFLEPYYPRVFAWPRYIPKTTALPDSELEAKIRDELLWDASVDSWQIDVDVTGGKARLSGAVDSWFERLRAVANAYEAGAIAVDDEMVIR